MSSHKSDEDMPDCELYDHHKTVFVAPDVKDIMLVPYIVCRRKVCLDIRKVLPFCLFCDVIPSFKCSLSVSMAFRTIELDQSSM